MLLYRPFRPRPAAAAVAAALCLCGTLAAAPLSADENGRCDNNNPSRTRAQTHRHGGSGLPDGATRVRADEISGQSGVAVHAQGNVTVERGDQILDTPSASYDQQADRVRTPENFVLQQDGSRVSGENLDYRIGSRSGSADNIRFETERNGRRLQGSGERLEMENGRHYRVQNAEFNTCNFGDNSWYIRAAEIEADYLNNVGIARNASLVLGGVPVFYTPWIDFPLDGGRKSGFLLPSLKSGSDGTQLSLPYYFNIAPNYDATLTPTVHSRRGLQLAGQFRYLRENYRGEMAFSVLPNDRLNRSRTRIEADWEHRHQIRPGLNAGIDFHQVSDDGYYRDFYGRNDIAANTNLNRQIWLRYDTALFGGRFNGEATVQKYQTLANTSGYKDAPYALLPRLSGNWQKHLGHGLDFNLYGELTRFVHPYKTEGSRLVLHPVLHAEYNRPWGYLRPEIQLHATRYRIHGTSAHSRSRIIPLFNLEAGLNFERSSTFLGRNYLQTLEPRLFYAYAPAKNQERIPLFDTAENSFTYDQLFRANRFSGHDRINAANFLTAAVQTRLIDTQDGSEQLRAGIGQRLYFSRDEIGLDGKDRRREGGSSDIFAFAAGRLGQRFHLESDLHYNTALHTAERYRAALRYSPAPGKTVSIGYRYRRHGEIYDGRYGKTRQADIAFQWPLRPNLYLIGRHSYSFSEHKPIEHMLGVEYSSPCGCWGISAAGQHYLTGPDRSKNAFFLQLRLRDLSSLGNNPFRQLRQSVPGYTDTEELNRQ